MVTLEEVAGAQAGDLIVTRKLGKMGEVPYLVTKLPHRMNEKVRHRLPCEALALVLGRHQEERLKEFLFVLCDDCIGWIGPDDVDRFLTTEEGTVQTSPSAG